MLRLIEDDRLTVYNGIEERSSYKSLDGSRPLPDRCCRGGGGECFFKEESDTSKIHRKLVLGEPFKITLRDSIPNNPIEDLFLSWDSGALENILDIAAKALEEMKGREPFQIMKADREEKDLFLAVALIRIFIQLNYTGPDIPSGEVMEKLRLFHVPSADAVGSEVNKGLRELLDIEGSELEESVKAPALLLIAKHFLSSMENDPAVWPFYLIWRFRIDFLHQRMLSRRSWLLSRNLKYYADKFINWLESHSMDAALQDVKASFMCEISQMLVYYYDGILSQRFLTQAKESLNITVNFSGKMGFRTKYQQTPAPQTVVNVLLPADSANCVRCAPFPAFAGNVPRSEVLNDDTRLDKIRLVDEEVAQPHDGIHQLILLGMMFHMRGMDETELDRQEIQALISAVIEHPLTWSARFSALMERCRLEKLDRRAIDRCLRQLEDLYKIVTQGDETAHTLYRQHLFFGSGQPTKAEIKILLGEIFLSLEHWKEALTIYTELGLFEKVVICYEMMSLRHKAEEIVREKISELGETPKLLVLLGDVTSEISNYEKAWELSSHKSFDSQIRLGNHHFRRQEYTEAVVYFKRVVELVPLEYPCWIKLAWACYQTEDYETAYQAYLYAANLEYDNFQVWNNLANCALKLNRKEYALRAYKEAVKCSYDEWRVWSNILSVATELKVLTDAVLAYHRILDLNKQFTDEMALDQIANIVLTEPKPKVALIGNLTKLFGRVTAMGTRNYHIWLVYGRLLAAYIECNDEECNKDTKVASFQRGLQYYDKALTLMRQNPTWKSDLSLIRNVVNCITEFRIQRQRGETILGSECTQGLNNLDLMLKQTASSVHETLKKIAQEIPPNEKLDGIFSDMANEIKNPFYA